MYSLDCLIILYTGKFVQLQFRKFCSIDELNFVSRFPQLQFQYKDPERGFDRRAVHGLVARLITVKDPETATALEVSAGGRVRNCVIVLGSYRPWESLGKSLNLELKIFRHEKCTNMASVVENYVKVPENRMCKMESWKFIVKSV